MSPTPCVIDSNIFVSALWSVHKPHAPSRRILDAVLAQRIRPVFSSPLVYDLAGGLLSSGAFDDHDVVNYVSILLDEGISDVVAIRGLDYGCRDPRDNRVIETAYNARPLGVRWLLTHDNDIKAPVVESFLNKHGVHVVSASRFLQLMAEGAA